MVLPGVEKVNDPVGRLTFEPSGRVVAAGTGQTLLDLARRARVMVDHTCSGAGTCGKCQLRVQGAASPVTLPERHFLTLEQLENGVRLACQVQPEGDINVLVQETGPLEILSDGLPLRVRVEPFISKEYVELPEPSIHDQRDPLARLQDRLGGRLDVRPDLGFLSSLSAAFEAGSGHLTLLRAGRELLDVEPGDTRATLLGAAFDIGTTTVVCYLWDLCTGELLDVRAAANPQTAYGADVIARIQHAQGGPRAAVELRKAINGGINQMLAEACDGAGVSLRHVYEIVFAGNTTMLHLLAGLPVESIARSPYVPAVRQGLSLEARDLWLKVHPRARACLMPHVASYVGADIVADLVASRIHRSGHLTLLVDFGTNAEIVLGSRRRLVACSAAAGPCFEGGNISCGMRASRGAISGASLEDGRLKLETVRNGAPAGICGTGLLDLVSLLREYDVVDESGRLQDAEELPTAPAALLERLEPGPSGTRFLLAAPGDTASGSVLTLTGRDIRELQVAKAAIAAGIRVLCKQLEVDRSEIREVLLAGAFGSSIRCAAALSLGLLPRCPRAKYRSIGNGAGAGAQMVLLSASSRREAERIARRVEYVELSASPSFTDAFMEEIVLAPTG